MPVFAGGHKVMIAESDIPKFVYTFGLLLVLMLTGCTASEVWVGEGGSPAPASGGAGGVSGSLTVTGGAPPTAGATGGEISAGSGGVGVIAGSGGVIAGSGGGAIPFGGSGGVEPPVDAGISDGTTMIDNCPLDPDKTEPGECGCGTPDTDSDLNGIPDCNEQTPPVTGCEVTAVPDDIRASYGLAPFYQKFVSANGIVVASSSQVSDEALVRNCRLLLDFVSVRDDIRQVFISTKVYFVMIAPNEVLSSLPEIMSLYGTVYDARARGLGSIKPSICAEDSIMCHPGDLWRGDCICVHEYGHTLADLGARFADPTFQSRLNAAYTAAQFSGLYGSAYAMKNASEYWTFGVQCWYNCAPEGTRGGYHSDINTRDELRIEDPTLYDLVAEVLPDQPQYQDCYAK